MSGPELNTFRTDYDRETHTVLTWNKLRWAVKTKNVPREFFHDMQTLHNHANFLMTKFWRYLGAA